VCCVKDVVHQPPRACVYVVGDVGAVLIFFKIEAITILYFVILVKKMGAHTNLDDNHRKRRFFTRYKEEVRKKVVCEKEL
jgi:hypothetical protein